MDQVQRDRIDFTAHEISQEVDAHEFGKLLDENGLIAKERIETILTGAGSNYLRNIRLLNAVQACKNDSAYDKLIDILSYLDSSSVHKLHIRKPKSTSGTKNILGSLMNTFKSKGRYPLGKDSGTSGYMTTTPSGRSSHDSRDNLLYRYKEKSGQPTLISSNSSSASKSSQEALTTNPDFRLQRTNPEGVPVTPNARGSKRADSTQVGGSNKLTQTPSRPSDLTLTSLNLSILEEGPENQNQSEQQDHSRQDETCVGGACLSVPANEPVISWHPYAPSPTWESAQRATNSPTFQHHHTCYSSASSESGESSSESLLVDPSLILDPNVMTAIAREGPNMMTVKMANVCHSNFEEDYKMTARPRGLCLIVNNINFEGEIFPTRKGSDEDANRFDQIFRQLGFQTIMTRNLTAEQMRQKFIELSKACKPEHDALFVFILSHGSEHGIYGTDGLEVYLSGDVLTCFDNRNCKAMIGKPKVFVIQACRGRAKDSGGDGDATDSIAWVPGPSNTDGRTPSHSQDNRVPASWLPTSQPSDGKKRKHPIRTDMLLVFSCLAGFVSVRNETAGSWLGVALAYFIMTHAHERDLLRILNLVTSDIIQRESTHGHIQSIEIQLLGWTKNLYFNPGIYLK